MKSASGKREVHARELLVLAVLSVCIVGVICLAVIAPSIDESHMEPIHGALAVPRIVSQSTGPISATRPSRETPAEKWAADESSRGLGTDAPH